MIFEESYTLHNGVVIPKLALGTWFIDDDKAAEAVQAAVNIGYRHIDTAQAYGNERGVGEGIRTCGIDRKLCVRHGIHRKDTGNDGTCLSGYDDYSFAPALGGGKPVGGPLL